MSSAAVNAWEKGYWGIGVNFGLDKWSFPSGEAVYGNYADTPNGRCNLVTLERLTNNYGRFITTAASATPWKDDTGRATGNPYTTLSALSSYNLLSPDGAPSGFAYQQAFALPSGRSLVMVGTQCQAGFKDPYMMPRSYCGEIDLYFNDTTHPLQRVLTDLNDEGVASIVNGVGNATAFAIVPGYRAATISPLNEVSATAYDTKGWALETRDPLNRVTTYAYDGRGRKILETYPELNSTGYTYDVRSNVLSTIRHSKPTAVPILADTTSSRSYGEGISVAVCANPVICNAPVTDTDALLRVTNYTWNATTGQITQILKPADGAGLRPQTDFGYTAIAATDGGSISLLNSKTVKTSATASTVTAFAYDPSNHLSLKTATVDPSGLNLRTCFKFDAVGNLVSTTDPRGATCP
jgi:YD repeat-containing protein